MVQSGHVVLDAPIWEMVTADYMRDPVKPVLDGEPNYQDLCVNPVMCKNLVKQCINPKAVVDIGK